MLYNLLTPTQQEYWQPRRDLTTVIIPTWIEKLLHRNQLDYIDLLNYDKIRSYLSVEDMAQLLCLNGYFKHFVLKDFVADCTLENEWYKTISSKNHSEFTNVIYPLATSDASASAVSDRLHFDDGQGQADCCEFEDPLLKVNGEDQSGKLARSIAVQGRSIFLVLEKGILNTLEVRDARFNMVSEYLKALYSVLPMKEVSKYYGAFEHYFNML